MRENLGQRTWAGNDRSYNSHSSQPDQHFVGQVEEIHLSLGFLHRLSVGLTDKSVRGNELLENTL